jgi:AcrR family transcriptional regulator
MSLRERKKIETKKRIINEGRRLFEKQGFENTSVDEICDKVMISKATFYNYFVSKDKLFISMYDSDFNDILAVLDKEDYINPIDKLKKVYLTMLESAIGYNYMVGMSYLLMIREPDFKPVLDKFKKAIYLIIEEAKKESFAKGYDPQEVLIVLNSIYYGIVLEVDEKDYKQVFLSMFDKVLMK